MLIKEGIKSVHVFSETISQSVFYGLWYFHFSITFHLVSEHFLESIDHSSLVTVREGRKRTGSVEWTIGGLDVWPTE